MSNRRPYNELARALYLATRQRSEAEARRLVSRFAEVVVRRFGRATLTKVLERLPDQADRLDGRETVRIESARELAPETVAEVLRSLGLPPDQTEVRKEIKPELIGGVRIRRADTLIDGSIRRQLDRLRQSA